MTDTVERLTRCFVSVFPDLDGEQARRASAASLSRWDSVTHVLLLSVVAEEFQVEFDPEQYELLTSFALIGEAVKEKLRDA